jgi:RNA polymerase sigma factor (sigma-70 family)
MAHMDQMRTSEDAADINCQERVRLATEVFHKYHREIRAMIHAVVSNPGEADDLFQNLFLSLVAKPLPPDIRSVKRYLYRAIVNDVISQDRREESRFRHTRVYALRQKWLRMETDPRDPVIAAEQTHRMFQMVDRLGPTEAQAVIREFALDHDRDKASCEMGVKRRSFTKYLSRGIRRLRFIAIAREGSDP